MCADIISACKTAELNSSWIPSKQLMNIKEPRKSLELQICRHSTIFWCRWLNYISGQTWCHIPYISAETLNYMFEGPVRKMWNFVQRISLMRIKKSPFPQLRKVRTNFLERNHRVDWPAWSYQDPCHLLGYLPSFWHVGPITTWCLQTDVDTESLQFLIGGCRNVHHPPKPYPLLLLLCLFVHWSHCQQMVESVVEKFPPLQPDLWKIRTPKVRWKYTRDNKILFSIFQELA